MKTYSLVVLLVGAALPCLFCGRSLAQQQKERTVLEADKVRVYCVAFSPDSKTLAAACEDETIKLLDVTTGKKIATLTGHKGPVTSVAFSPDGKTLASAGSKDASIKLWDVASGQNTATLKGHKSQLWCVVFSPDGKTLASTSVDNTVKLWDVASGKNTATLTGHWSLARYVAFSPDGKYVVSSGAALDKTTNKVTGEAKLWDVANGKNIANFEGHTGTVECAAFSPDGKTVATASLDRTVKLWDVASKKNIASLKTTDTRSEGNGFFSVVFTPDGKTLAAASQTTSSIHLWDVSDVTKPLAINTLRGHPPLGVTYLAWSPDGKTLASSSDDKTIKLWDFDGDKKEK